MKLDARTKAYKQSKGIKSARDVIVDYLAEHSEVPTSTISSDTNITSPLVRHHVKALYLDGIVIRSGEYFRYVYSLNKSAGTAAALFKPSALSNRGSLYMVKPEGNPRKVMHVDEDCINYSLPVRKIKSLFI